jgi:hypothetical protein
LYQQFFFASGQLSVSHFATSLIVPEVRQQPTNTIVEGGSPVVFSTDLIERNGVSKQMLDAFKSHDHQDSEADHALLPVELLKEQGALTRQHAAELFSTLDYSIGTFDVFLRGVLRHYQGWDGKLVQAPPGEF